MPSAKPLSRRGFAGQNWVPGAGRGRMRRRWLGWAVNCRVQTFLHTEVGGGKESGEQTQES